MTMAQSLYIEWSQSPRVMVEVGGTEKDLEKKVFLIPRDLLVKRSAPFSRMLEGHFAEAETSLIKLPEVSVAAFTVFYIWTMSPHPRISEDLDLEVLLDLAIFATEYIIFALQNQAMDVLVEKLSSDCCKLSIYMVARCYSAVNEESKLRKLLKLNLGNLTPGDTGQWKKLFLEYPDLGWDFFEYSSQTSYRSTPKKCDFHDHDRPPPKVTFSFGYGHDTKCPFEGDEAFAQHEYEQPYVEDKSMCENKKEKKKKKKKPKALPDLPTTGSDNWATWGLSPVDETTIEYTPPSVE